MSVRPKTETEPLAYDVSGAARVMGVGRNKIYDEIQAGRLEAHKLGRRTVITRAAIEAWFGKLPRFTTSVA